MAKKPRKLTAKQLKYRNLRLKGKGVSESYRGAYNCKKMGFKSISVAANVLENDPRISVVLEEAKQREFEKSIMGRDEALQRLTLHGRVKMTDVATFRNVRVGEDKDGDDVFQTVWTIKNSEDIPPEVAACIKSVTMTKDGPKIELYDNDKAISQLRAMQGWDKPKKHAITDTEGKTVPLGTNVSVPEIVEAVAGILEKL